MAGVWVWTTDYGFTSYSAAHAAPVRSWPEATHLRPAEERPTLLLFMHPRCPCTRATVSELERVLTGAGLSDPQLPKCVAVVSLPQGATAEWRDTDTVRRVSGLPHAEVVWDTDGVEAKRFGAVTSGAVRLYQADGDALFAGGVTASRGHEGDNAGSDRLLESLRHPTAAWLEPTPAFGCRLYAESPIEACDESCRPASLPDEDPAA